MASANDKKENSDEGLKKFSGHQGVVSCVRFLNSMFMISASFDSVILLWDVNSQWKYVASYHDLVVRCLDSMWQNQMGIYLQQDQGILL